MTLSPEDKVLIRSHYGTVKRYVSIAPRTIVYSAQVNGNPIKDADTNGIIELNYDNGSGTLGDVKIGYTIDIGTTPGASDVGQFRVRKAPTSSKFYVNEVGEVEIPVKDNHYISVVYERRIWQKRVRRVEETVGPITTYTEYRDYDEEYNNQNVNIQPQANITEDGYRSAKHAGWHDVGQTYRTVNLDSSTSEAVAPGATVVSRLWDIDDGTLVGGSLSNQAITVRFPKSKLYRYISLTVTDSNGTTHTRYFDIWVHSVENPPLTIFSVSKDNRSDKGREMTFSFFSNQNNVVDETVIPKGCRVCYWEEATFFGLPAPNDYIRESSGWAISQAIPYKLGGVSRYSLSIASVGYLLSKLKGYSQELIDPTSEEDDANAVPDTWYEMTNISLNRTGHYLLRYYTNVLDLTNFYQTDVNDLIEGFHFDSSDVWSQLQKVYERARYSAAWCDADGNIWCRRLGFYLNNNERATRGVWFDLVKSDWSHDQGLDTSEDFLQKIGWLEAYGANYDILLDINNNRVDFSKQWYAVAPGKAQGYGNAWDTAPFQHLGTSEAAKDILAELTGHHYARLNNRRNEIQLRLITNMDVFEPAWGIPVTVEWDGDTLRGEKFTITCVVKSVSIQHQGDRKIISLTLEEMTQGQPVYVEELTAVE